MSGAFALLVITAIALAASLTVMCTVITITRIRDHRAYGRSLTAYNAQLLAQHSTYTR